MLNMEINIKRQIKALKNVKQLLAIIAVFESCWDNVTLEGDCVENNVPACGIHNV